MRLSLFTVVIYAGLWALVAGWGKEEHEIFRLRDELEIHEGPGVTFYDFVGVKPGASQSDIHQAFKKKGRLLHPDKVAQSFVASKAKPPKGKPGTNKKPGVHVSKRPTEKEIKLAVKEATDRFARLASIAEILRGEGRDRYDHFLSNGFPKWRGTGYYYARFRPGLISTLVGMFIFGGGLVHYGVLVLSWQRQREFVNRYIRQARKTAWGDETGISGIPGVDALGGIQVPIPITGEEDGQVAMNRRQKRLQERESKKKDAKGPKLKKLSGTSTPLETAPDPAQGPQGQKKRVQAENGKTLIVDASGNVYLEEENEDGEKAEFLLDPDEIMKPTFKQTVLYRLPFLAYESTIRLFSRKSPSPENPAMENESEESSTEEEEEAAAKLKPSGNGTARKRGKRNGKVR